jgi:hypothetical protein
MAKKALTLAEKCSLLPSFLFADVKNRLKKDLPKRKVDVDCQLESADFGKKANVYVYTVSVVVHK